MKSIFFNSAAALFISAICCQIVYASIQISSTRVIYRETEKNVSIQISNPGTYPVLLQSWIDEGRPEIKPEDIKAPFILTPPLTRVNAGEGQTLRLSYVGPGQVKDRESIYWLNVLEIPPVINKESNQVQVAFRSRIKVFYRPTGLDDKGAQSAAEHLRWDIQGKKMTILNPTPYYVSLLGISLKLGNKKTTIPAEMIDPQSRKVFDLPAGVEATHVSEVAVDFINDYGAITTKPLVK
ncbi:fimbrial biogenesis chaperone [Enterobacter asburiae]|uniref:fimbrial biogenesis chaperone n=1 Tax=Enterobacter asburiae TaxID=61645 RepID=UPI00192B7E74|nr:molecular chaperone [Enterobacter asburiae]MBL5926314.1 molecular chaperone [Enterobacter asburiae]MBL5957099.1 molecular chaperone [Enterobacter asburiae]